MNQTSQSTGIDGSRFKDRQNKKRRKTKRQDQARRTNISKDLIDIISNQSAEDSEIDHTKTSKGVKINSKTDLSNQKSPPRDKKNDTQITFFQENGNRNALVTNNSGINKKRYRDTMNATESTFHAKKNKITPLVSEMKRSKSPQRYNKIKNVNSPSPKRDKNMEDQESPLVISPITEPVSKK